MSYLRLVLLVFLCSSLVSLPSFAVSVCPPGGCPNVKSLGAGFSQLRDSCEGMMSVACKHVPQNSRRACSGLPRESTPEYFANPLAFVGGCLVGIADSAWEIASYLAKTIKNSMRFALDRKFRGEVIDHGLDITAMLMDAIWEDPDGFFKNLLTQAVSYIKQEYKEFETCLTPKAQAEAVCGLLGYSATFYILTTRALVKLGIKLPSHLAKLQKAKFKVPDLKQALFGGQSKRTVTAENLTPYMSSSEKRSFFLKFQESLKTVNEKFQDVINNSKGAVLFHGSNSSSLLAFSANKTLGGLRPTGYMREKGITPFSGELAWGVGPNGVNQKLLSAAKITDLDLAMRYTNLSVLRNNSNQALKLFSDPEVSKKVSAGRKETWTKLSSRDKKYINENYPVLYGLGLKNPPVAQARYLGLDAGLRKEALGVGVEVSIPDGVSFSEIKSIFVPKKKVRSVKKLLKSQGLHKDIAVSPIESVQKVLEGYKAYGRLK